MDSNDIEIREREEAAALTAEMEAIMAKASNLGVCADIVAQLTARHIVAVALLPGRNSGPVERLADAFEGLKALQLSLVNRIIDKLGVGRDV